MKGYEMKRKTIILYVLAVFMLGGCGKESFPEETEIEMVEAEEIPAEETSEEEREQEPEKEADQKLSEEAPEEMSGENEEQGSRQEEGTEPAGLQKYQAVLRDVLEKQIYPDGSDCGFDGVTSLSDNKFAVYDVDKDGRKELLLCITATSMAGMREIVYDYNEKADVLTEEFSGFPGVVFYENGLAEEGLSHNHGMAPLGDFWPYMLHRYQPEEDIYQCIFLVDAWEKEYMAQDYDGNPYPEDVDTDGSGIIYFTMTGGEYDTASTEPISGSAYEKWRKDQGLESAEIEIFWQALTEENIEDILGNS